MRMVKWYVDVFRTWSYKGGVSQRTHDCEGSWARSWPLVTHRSKRAPDRKRWAGEHSSNANHFGNLSIHQALGLDYRRSSCVGGRGMCRCSEPRSESLFSLVSFTQVLPALFDELRPARYICIGKKPLSWSLLRLEQFVVTSRVSMFMPALLISSQSAWGSAQLISRLSTIIVRLNA